MLPDALSIGVPYETFWHLTPKKLKAFYRAFEQRLERTDRLVWQWTGNYFMSAIAATVGPMLAGRKSRAKYPEKPAFEDAMADKRTLDEYEIQRQREAFVMRMRAMKANFDIAHPKKMDE